MDFDIKDVGNLSLDGSEEGGNEWLISDVGLTIGTAVCVGVKLKAGDGRKVDETIKEGTDDGYFNELRKGS